MQSLEVVLLKNNLSVIILAAGKGTRMCSDIPKVLNQINNKSMIEHVLEQTYNLKPEKLLVVIGYEYQQIKKYLKGHPLHYVLQKEQLGTAHAIMQCQKDLKNFKGSTLILSGDVPLIKSETLQKLYNTHTTEKAQATILSAKIENPYGYGRIVRENNSFISIVEEKDATEIQKNIKEINGGIYIFDNKILFENINNINNNNSQSEYYLPDIMSILVKKNYKVLVHQIQNEHEIKGANTKEQLLELEKYAK